MERKWIQLLYAAAAIILCYLLGQGAINLWRVLKITSVKLSPSYIQMGLYGIAAVISFVIVLIAWRNEKIYTWVSECVGEISKVSWPTPKEVGMATMVVVVMVAIAATFLWLFDQIWSKLSTILYNS